MALAAIFNQTQTSLANHKKNCVNLYKIHVEAAGQVESNSKVTVKLVGEEAFARSFLDMVSRALVVKKGVASADRIVKFVGAYVKFINEKAGKRAAQMPPEVDEDEDTFVSRFVTRILKWVMQGFLAKDKNVRYRSLFIVSEMVLWLGELDMDLYEELRENLIQRLCDKETAIRAQCVIALARLSATEDPSELEEGAKSILELLTESLLYDAEKEVRRTALIHIPLTLATIDVLLSCSRDVDLFTRKLLYSTVLFSKLDNPRSLTLVQREKVIKDGLGDREGTVRASASKLIMKWFNMLLDDVNNNQTETWQGDDGGIMKALIRFLELFDVVGSEQIALDALNAIFVLKPEYLDIITFSDEYWTELTPESAVLAHAFVINSQGTVRAEEAGLPVVTAFAFHIQSLYNKLLDKLNIAETAEEAELDDDVTESLEDLHKIASILSSILSIAAGLDYGDEIGRRKTVSVIKDMLTHPGLPLDLIDPCMEVMRAMLPSERDFIRVMVEIVIDLRDEDEEEPVDAEISASFSDASQPTLQRERSFKRSRNREEMSQEAREAADLIDIRCLMLCNAVLERVNGSFEDNSTLQGILDDLIIPSVQRREFILREKALTGLGLCSLIAKKMALGSFQLFSNECLRSPDPIRVTVLRVIFDLILMYETEFFGKSEEMDSRLTTFLLSIMEAELGKNEPSPEILAILCIGFSKFLLLGVVDDPKMLLCLLVAYVSPDTVGNQEVRQCLSFFFMRYSTAHPRNKTRLQSIFISAFDTILRMNESLDDGQTMVAPEKMGEMLLSWTDPHLVLTDTYSDRAEHLDSIKDTHANVVINILLELYSSERSENELKLLCHLLNQPMYWPKDLDSKTIHMINLLLNNHEKQCPFEVSATTKLFERFKIRFKKLYLKQLEEINPGRYVHDDEVLNLYEAINTEVPESDGEMGSWSPLRKEMLK
ncbi:hypothetical protein AGABI2DRAFT_208301 [Agaricus bisporus var. bisporus H97]|uniref:hypothetical protein n=1 Tax=Agaricus bisporus var. bisporus (strain H97 / ATCC MYA-4626 / FGSC 10389) TaxID=936046 RepID=UPI00029F5B31|nr:hypothetical protein AGABI2DRAFT_208301 [Agaricus bisporus var. bisporus H97]EKV45336.1 hypothetical protein AGABI2DRAFT_208301 [Agaricus bisporus var. bisporus H97]